MLEEPPRDERRRRFPAQDKGQDPAHRIREGFERFLFTDAGIIDCMCKSENERDECPGLLIANALFSVRAKKEKGVNHRPQISLPASLPISLPTLINWDAQNV